jgi:outer membrane receptor protein involved in Fe transport
VQKLGIASNATDAATFLSTFVGTGATRPANAGGNPGLTNEEANNYTLGFTWRPSVIPRLTVAVDFYNVELKNEISLFGPGTFLTGCFDSKDFPNSISAGTRACDTFLYGIQGAGGGLFNIPTANALTGNPGTAGVLGGSPAAVQAPFELAFAQFANLNSGGRSFRGVNTEVRYDFQLGDLPFVGGYLGGAGEIFLKSSYFNTQRYDFDSGIIDPVAGEHGNPEHVVRNEILHRIGKFDHSLQWYWNSATVSDVQVDKALYPERTPSFFAPAFNFFNYAASYKINDNFVVRATISNLFNTQDPRGIYGIANRYDGGIGREFIIGLNARF